MRLDWKQLKNLAVETKSGVSLGKVKDFILDTAGQNILQYEVGGIFEKKYLISYEQIIRFEEDRLVVDDNVVKDLVAKAEERKKGIEPEPVVMRKISN